MISKRCDGCIDHHAPSSADRGRRLVPSALLFVACRAYAGMFSVQLQRWTEPTALEKLGSFSSPSSHVQVPEPVDQSHEQQQADVSQCLICCQIKQPCRRRSSIAKLCICDKVRCTPQRAVRSLQSASPEQALTGGPPTGCQTARGSVCWCALCPNAASAHCWTSSWLPCLRLFVYVC